ncbi:MAG TPA: patatin-like phospholipase family protein [bacterium]|nr:patatin-like phospholipase family protein [bacterium]
MIIKTRLAIAMLVMAVQAGVPTWSQQTDPLLLASTPIIYGEAGFRERILARTKGLREPVGLVLSGGSARAFAHIGVLKRLEEAGIVPDFIVANSMGSIIGLLYAAGLSPDQLYELVSRTELNALFSPVFPVTGGILDPRRFSDLIRLYLGDLRLEDLPIPILIACEDLLSKRQILLAEGDLLTIMEAGYALPVFFPPVPYDGHLLIDGGITNLVPLGLATKYSEQVIVSSTFYDAKGLNLRNPLVVLNTALDIGKRRAGVVDILRYPEAIWIRCDVESFSFMSFDRVDELASLGYASAEAVSTHLGTLTPGGIDRRLEEARAEYDTAIVRASSMMAPFDHAPSKRPALAMTARLDSTAYPGDQFYLNDTIFFGAGLGFRLGSFELGADGGADWNAYSDGTIMPSITVSGLLDVMPWLRLSALTLANWPDDNAEDLPLLYQRSSLTAAFPWGDGRLELFSGLEQDRIGLDGSRMLLTSGLTLLSNGAGPWSEARLDAGHQYDIVADRHFGFAVTALSYAPSPFLVISAGGMTRVAFDPDGRAPFFLSDPLSVADASRVDAIGRAMFGASLSAGWIPADMTISFSELVIMRDIELTMFVDSAWAGQRPEPASIVVGLRLGCDIALMGLQSLRTRAEVGIDPQTNALVARLFLLPSTR